MDNKIKHIIVFPDIHGRDFWKSVVNEYIDNEEYLFVFLGDYLDPYEDIDGITEIESLQNFHDLCDTLKDHKRTVMLFGNHDWHYLPWMRNRYGCRRSEKFFDTISDFFYTNYDKFGIAYEHVMDNGTRYLFTHAGVTTGWAKELMWLVDGAQPEEIQNGFKKYFKADNLNALKYNLDKRFLLWRISRERYGDDPHGSCLWSDFYEMIETESLSIRFYSDLPYQVYGHSYSSKEYIGENCAMLDCKSAFMIDCKDGKISKLPYIKDVQEIMLEDN